MLVQKQAQIQAKAKAKPDSYYDGEFDAAIALYPKSYEGDYWQGYLAQVNKTSKTPF
ncbi:hypothetical protein [Nostoc sp. MG11]|uniref:hypothetical protein n=1 Tax=Nostoc sp. MG11 TaxID=2721166 RepID=UPI001866DE5A|nr:hypothetical protein [Nostoc sp. MG11]